MLLRTFAYTAVGLVVESATQCLCEAGQRARVVDQLCEGKRPMAIQFAGDPRRIVCAIRGCRKGRNAMCVMDMLSLL